MEKKFYKKLSAVSIDFLFTIVLNDNNYFLKFIGEMGYLSVY